MMKWMECRATRREIDEGGEHLTAQALRHVASCAPCLAFQNERTRLRDLLTSLEPVTAPADFDFRLRARMAAQTERLGPRSFFSGFALSTPAMAGAAAVVIVALSAVWFVRLNQNRTPLVVSNPQGQERQGNSPATGYATLTHHRLSRTAGLRDRSMSCVAASRRSKTRDSPADPAET